MRKKHHQHKSFKNLPSEYKDLKDFIIDLSDFKKLDVLGKGSFSTVWKAQHITNGWIVAIKEFLIIPNKNENLPMSPSNSSQSNSFSEKDFYREIRILSKCINNPFFVQLIGFSINNTYAIVTSFVPCGSLWDILHLSKDEHQNDQNQTQKNSTQNVQLCLNDTQKNFIALGLSYAMKYLHSQNIIHLDFKSPNILFDDRILPKIADLGLSQFYNPNSKSDTDIPLSSEKVAGPPSCISKNGTPMWMSPEQICGLKCGPKSDVYSFGIILYELLTGKEPYTGLNDVQIFYKVVRSNERPKLPEESSPLSHLISSCWDSDPQNRPTFSEIYELFQSGEVMFPNSHQPCMKEILRIIENHEKDVRESARREAAVLNRSISLRQMKKEFDNQEGSPEGSTKGSIARCGSPAYFSSCLTRLAALGKVNELDIYVSSLSSLDLNKAGEDGLTPIKAAIINDQLSVVQFLVRIHNITEKTAKTAENLGAPLFDINATDNEGNTAFLLSVILFRPRIVAYLAQVKSVDVNAQICEGCSALHLLMKIDNENGRSVMLKALSFAANLKTDLKDKDGKTPFEGNSELMNEFIKRQEKNRTSNF